MTAAAEKAADDLAPGGRRGLFGDVSLVAEQQRTTTLPDAVRRCRWIAIDMNAAGFTLLFAESSLERPLLAPCFDSDYPEVSAATKLAAGPDRLMLARHARASSVPCWWSDMPGSASDAALSALRWANRIEPLMPGACGVAFPVHADYGRYGLVVFFGPDIMLDSEGLFDAHARCFSLFEAVARMRPGDSARVPSISKRELECLKLTANGYTSEEIARLLSLSVHTANQYLSNTTQKLDAVNRMHAVAKALRMGLID
ncbi:helix-turn-helix transcriptional regulator [Mesorhizobium marinum]|uniref:helix-turn-helix transcriptional regulator n=1 Tax=Mesorhizobium marinum TaxID=3228790 RepID=UPI003465F8CD